MLFRSRTAYAFHSQGEEIYYRYGPHTPARSQLMAQVLASSCGYRLASPEGTASHGGFKDWFIDCMRRPGFTFEIGRGKNPLPIQEFEPIYARLAFFAHSWSSEVWFITKSIHRLMPFLWQAPASASRSSIVPRFSCTLRKSATA